MKELTSSLPTTRPIKTDPGRMDAERSGSVAHAARRATKPTQASLAMARLPQRLPCLLINGVFLRTDAHREARQRLLGIPTPSKNRPNRLLLWDRGAKRLPSRGC